MSVENGHFVVGLIAIESVSEVASNREVHVDCDATLGEFLIHLASNGVQAYEALEMDGLPSLPAAGNRFASQTQVSARLKNLAAELELAVAHVRRKIAASFEPAA